MKKLMGWLVPKKYKFFDMLLELSEIALECGKELKIFIDSYSNLERAERKERTNIIKKLAHKGEEISKRIFERPNKNFRTPIRKSNFQEITVPLVDLIELIHDVSLRFIILSIERIEAPIIKLIDKICDALSELNKGILDLRKPRHIEMHSAKIHALEEEADEIYYEALSDLFHYYKNSIDLIKYKEIYEYLENIMNKCKDIADVFEGKAVNYA